MIAMSDLSFHYAARSRELAQRRYAEDRRKLVKSCVADLRKVNRRSVDRDNAMVTHWIERFEAARS